MIIFSTDFTSSFHIIAGKMSSLFKKHKSSQTNCTRKEFFFQNWFYYSLISAEIEKNQSGYEERIKWFEELLSQHILKFQKKCSLFYL